MGTGRRVTIKRKPVAAPWRILAQGPNTHRVAMQCVATDFDELVVGDWLHLERMSHACWWMQVGETHIWMRRVKGKWKVGLEKA